MPLNKERTQSVASTISNGSYSPLNQACSCYFHSLYIILSNFSLLFVFLRLIVGASNSALSSSSPYTTTTTTPIPLTLTISLFFFYLTSHYHPFLFLPPPHLIFVLAYVVHVNERHGCHIVALVQPSLSITLLSLVPCDKYCYQHCLSICLFVVQSNFGAIIS